MRYIYICVCFCVNYTVDVHCKASCEDFRRQQQQHGLSNNLLDIIAIVKLPSRPSPLILRSYRGEEFLKFEHASSIFITAALALSG